MAANFLHGVETIEVEKGGRAVKLVKSSVIGVVGTAPIHLVDPANRTLNRPVQVLSDKDAVAFFGPERPGFTIPDALEAVRKQGRGVCIVVNVFDPAIHKSSAAQATYTLIGNSVALPHKDILTATLKTAADVALVAGVDYTLNQASGLVTRLPGGALSAGASFKAAYDYADLTKVTPADIIGTVDAAGLRTGMQAWLDSFTQFGYFPKNLIAPVYGTLASVMTELDVLAGRLRGHFLVDAPIGTTLAQALAGRGPEGAINFNVASKRAVLCYPHVKVYDAASNSTALAPYCPRLAGVWAETDIAEGYWVSPSNREIKGIVGMERPLTAMINDPNSEVNILNEAGITTIYNSWGSGLRTWGNRSAAWPSNTSAKQFVAVQRTLDVIHESVEYAMLQFLDGPLDAARIDAILATVNTLVRKLIADGALVDGRYWFDPAENPVTELANGHLTLSCELTPPSPMERVTFKSAYNAEGLAKLYGALAA